jgi:anaerobic magnesium-protoporphyrin IX monomethyl ester cyclase
MIDAMFVVPGNAKGIYQDLSNDYSAIETPTWALLLGESTRSVGFNISLIDANAENLSHPATVERIKGLEPRLIVFVVYGQNVNAGTTGMSGAVALSKYIKYQGLDIPVVYIGSHVQALPVDTLEKEKSIDIVCLNEGVYALHNLLNLKDFEEESLVAVKGIGYRKHDGVVHLTAPEQVVPQERLDIDLPGYAWDLLPYNKVPLDLYRSPMWHAEYDFNKRTPYAAIQTSLGCRFGCDFCMINMINRNDNEEIGVAGNYSMMRYWSTEFIIKEFDKLLDMGVKTIRIVDEMFLLNPKYYIPLCEKLAERNKNDELRMWAYSRIDTIKRPDILKLVRKAGIKWLCLGIESGDKKVRLEVSKGKFEETNIKDVVNKVHEADIGIMANYIFGLPGDTHESMKKTFELSMDLCTVGWNAYAAMALPGSKLYKDAINNSYEMPEDYEGYSFHSYNTQPLPTENLLPKEILKYRDECYIKYHSSKEFLEKIRKHYGKKSVENISKMAKIKLKRKINGD